MASTLIRIIKGTYGYWDGVKVVPKTKEDEPFLVEFGRAKELVEMGVAELADADEEDEAKEVEDNVEVNLEEMTLDQLKEVAEPYGIKYKVGTKKVDFVADIRAAIDAEAEADEDADESIDEDADEEEIPEFSAEDAVQ